MTKNKIYRFLGEAREPPAASGYHRLFTGVFPQYGDRYLTDDRSVLRYRHILFDELVRRPSLTEAMLRFADSFDDPNGVPTSRSIITALLRQKQRLAELQRFGGILSREPLTSEAMLSLSEFIGGILISAKCRRMVDDFAKFPDRLENIRSVTLGINLDGNYNAAEAGIVSVNETYFTSASPVDQLLRMSRQNPAEPLIKITPSDDVRKLAQLNLELMDTVNRILRRELKAKEIRADTLLRYDFGLSDALLDEIRFAAAAAEVIRDMTNYGATFVYTETLDTLRTGSFLLNYKKMKLEYSHDLYERPEESEDERHAAELMLRLGLPVMTES